MPLLTTNITRPLLLSRRRRVLFIYYMQGSSTEDVPNFIVPTNGIEWRNEQAGNSSVIHNIRLSYQSASKPFINWSHFLTYSWSHLIPSRGNDPSSKTLPHISIASFSPFNSSSDKVLNIEDDYNTGMTISFEGSTIVNVNPDPEWYYSAYLNKVARLGSWQDGQTTEQIFGPSGFHSVITGFVAVYRPSFSISTSSQFYDIIKGIVTTGNQFTLGPFSFGTLNSPSEKDYSYFRKFGFEQSS